MKKLFILMQLTLAAIAYSSYASADYDDDDYGHHRHHHGHHHNHRNQGGIYYAPAPVVEYYAPPVVQYYAPPPVVQYYAPQPQVGYYPAPQGYYDQRSGSGLAGGVLGSVFGYEIGRGDPVATGLGAAAGSYMGNRY
jgi:hypothetical protein